MDLELVMAQLRPDENVAPDLSSYEAMVASWRGSGLPPTKEECEATHEAIQAAIPVEKKVQEEIVKQGYSTDVAVQALIRNAMGDPSMLNNLIKMISDAEAKFPDKV